LLDPPPPLLVIPPPLPINSASLSHPSEDKMELDQNSCEVKAVSQKEGTLKLRINRKAVEIDVLTQTAEIPEDSSPIAIPLPPSSDTFSIDLISNNSTTKKRNLDSNLGSYWKEETTTGKRKRKTKFDSDVIYNETEIDFEINKDSETKPKKKKSGTSVASEDDEKVFEPKKKKRKQDKELITISSPEMISSSHDLFSQVDADASKEIIEIGNSGKSIEVVTIDESPDGKKKGRPEKEPTEIEKLLTSKPAHPFFEMKRKVEAVKVVSSGIKLTDEVFALKDGSEKPDFFKTHKERVESKMAKNAAALREEVKLPIPH